MDILDVIEAVKDSEVVDTKKQIESLQEEVVCAAHMIMVAFD